LKDSNALEARTPAIASAVVDFTVRLAERRDAGAIRAIYNVEVAESTVTFDLVPRTLDEQVEWIDAHSGAHPAVVAIDEAGEVVGFGSLSPFKDRAAYSTTVEDSAATGAAWASGASCSTKCSGWPSTTGSIR
jgi:L-amino acid N-acyltransferase YncA